VGGGEAAPSLFGGRPKAAPKFYPVMRIAATCTQALKWYGVLIWQAAALWQAATNDATSAVRGRVA